MVEIAVIKRTFNADEEEEVEERKERRRKRGRFNLQFQL